MVVVKAGDISGDGTEIDPARVELRACELAKPQSSAFSWFGLERWAARRLSQPATTSLKEAHSEQICGARLPFLQISFNSEWHNSSAPLLRSPAANANA